MSEVERFSALVGNIYDASLDPALWPSVLQMTCEYVGGASAGLTSQETLRRTARIHFSWGSDPHYSRLYEEKYHRLNPAFPTVLFFAAMSRNRQRPARHSSSRAICPAASLTTRCTGGSRSSLRTFAAPL
jgi:hypothetical protein